MRPPKNETRDAPTRRTGKNDVQLKVMVAEDDSVSRRIAVRAVESFGCACVEARDGLEAWKMYREDPA